MGKKDKSGGGDDNMMIAREIESLFFYPKAYAKGFSLHKCVFLAMEDYLQLF